jgi:hypothetical protein
MLRKAEGRSAPAEGDMLKQELVFLKALTAEDISPEFYQHLMAVLGKKKRLAVPTRKRGTTVPQRTPAIGKQKPTEPVCASDSLEPATRRPATGADPASQQFQYQNATSKQAATESGMTHEAAAAVPYTQSGPLKPSANGSDPSETAVYSKTALGRISNDVSGLLSGTPDGTTTTAQLATNCGPAGQRRNKTPLFVTGVTETREFLTWFWSSCPCSLTAQFKAEKLMVVPSTADGFRATVSALRFLHGKERVSFHTSLPEDRCLRLLVKNLGKRLPESVVREDLGALDVRIQGVTKLRSGRRDQDPTKDRPHTLHFIISVACGPEVSRVLSLTELCGSRWRRTWRRRAPCNVSAASASQRNCGHVPRCVACVGSHSLASPQSLWGSPSAADVWATTRRTTGFSSNGRRRGQLLQSGRHNETAKRHYGQIYPGRVL